MIFYRRYFNLILVFLLFSIILIVNLYFLLAMLKESHRPQVNGEPEVTTSKRPNNLNGKKAFNYKNKKTLGKYYVAQKDIQLVATANASKKIKKAVEKLLPLYRRKSEKYNLILQRILEDLKPKHNITVRSWNIGKNASFETESSNWKIARNWVSGTHVLPERTLFLGDVLNSLCSSKIIKAENAKKGTQLKLLFTLEGGQQALFKPQWYSRDEVIKGPVYAGRDRHNAEVAAFHLSLLLNIRRVPLTVGRKVNLRREVMPVASQDLLNTFHQKGPNLCFYGVCMYCDSKNMVCAQKDIMEGALILLLPTHYRFERHSSPWQRSYKDDLIARWEVEENYCEKVKKTVEYNLKSSTRLLDLIDAVVFDFLLDNGDRHHYEVPSGMSPSSVFLFDNGKGFGNPHIDHLDILAPLYQCCVIRRKTWERLKMFAGGSLSLSLEQTLNYSHISPVLTKLHLDALDRRLLFIFATVEVCMRERGPSEVLL